MSGNGKVEKAVQISHEEYFILLLMFRVKYFVMCDEEKFSEMDMLHKKCRKKKRKRK